MRLLRRLFSIFLALCIFPSLALASGHREPGGYQYTPYDTVVAAPNAYQFAKSYYAGDIPGVQSLEKMQDAHVQGDLIYVLRDSELIILNRDFSLNAVLNSYTDAQGNAEKLKDCSGVTVTQEGEIYICRGDRGDILHFRPDFSLKRIIGRPDIKGFENVQYKPLKLAVDMAQRIYVVAKGMYEGIVELNPDGSFSRFYGVNRVKFTFSQYIWRLFATRAQLERQQLWLPTDFTNLCFDERGFLFATIQDSEGQIIKRLNSKGENILHVKDMEYPSGDVDYNQTGVGIPTGPSAFIAVDTNPYGIFLCLDQKRSRVFAYNEDGWLLYVIGGPGMSGGLFRNPIDVDFVGEDIMVLDALSQSIDLYRPTAYGKALHQAVRHQYLFLYEEAAEYWREALSYNHHLTLAYSGIGRSLLREGKYAEAMDYLRKGNDRTYYSKAFKQVRKQWLKQWFIPIVAVLIVLAVAGKVYRNLSKKRHQKKGVVSA